MLCSFLMHNNYKSYNLYASHSRWGVNGLPWWTPTYVSTNHCNNRFVRVMRDVKCDIPFILMVYMPVVVDFNLSFNPREPHVNIGLPLLMKLGEGLTSNSDGFLLKAVEYSSYVHPSFYILIFRTRHYWKLLFCLHRRLNTIRETIYFTIKHMKNN